MERRHIDWANGDRVARIPGTNNPTTDFNEAMTYAAMRALTTGYRQTVRRHNMHGWWIVLQSKAVIKSKVRV